LVFVFGGSRRIRSVIAAWSWHAFRNLCAAVAQLAVQVAGMQLDDYIPAPTLPTPLTRI
jgi:hypothetical protein